MKKVSIAWFLSFLLVSVGGIAQESNKESQGVLYNDSSFNDFSDKLLKAVQEKDTTFIFSRVDQGVFNGFGGNGGKKEFKMMWREPYNPLSEELAKALKLGAAFDKRTERVFAPYLWLTFPDSLDAFRYVYVLEEGTPAYAVPDTSTPVVENLSKKVIRVLSRKVSDEYEEYSGPVWLGLESETGDTLMVQNGYLRSPIDYRFWFEKKNRKWYLMGWAAGD